MTRPVARLTAFVLVLLSAVLACAVPAHAAGTAVCDRMASPFGSDTAPGTAIAPFRTAQRLADSLSPGQTGCLQSGTYSDEVTGTYVLRVGQGGTATAPITIRSAPGQRATLRGIVYIPQGSDHIVISDLDIDARRLVQDSSTGIQVNAADVTFDGNTITDNQLNICMVLGSPGWGSADRTIIRNNTFHNCGRLDSNKEHSIYVELTTGTLITDNLFIKSGAYAVHMYPYAMNTTVTHNVMVDNGGGAIFAGEDSGASSGNVVSQNIITGSYYRPGIQSSWGTTQGSNNLAKDNCLYDNPLSNVDLSGGGFAARNNWIADPDYRDAADGDYRLAPGSPCLSIVGYDTVAKLDGDDATTPPAATPTATATASATAGATATQTQTATPTSTATAAPTRTATPAATSTAAAPVKAPETTPVPTATAPPASPISTTPVTPAPTADATATVDTATQPPVAGSAPASTKPPVEAAVEIDTQAFSYSGGTAVAPTGCAQKPKRCR